jgi:hypothetical protein
LLTISDNSSKKTIDTEAMTYQNLDYSLEERRKIKHELQEESIMMSTKRKITTQNRKWVPRKVCFLNSFCDLQRN